VTLETEFATSIKTDNNGDGHWWTTADALLRESAFNSAIGDMRGHWRSLSNESRMRSTASSGLTPTVTPTRADAAEQCRTNEREKPGIFGHLQTCLDVDRCQQADSKTAPGNGLWVRIPPPAPSRRLAAAP
jgi:hypothetical protein